MAVVPKSTSRDVLIAWINRRLEVISEAQHRLALHRAVLQEQATRLRLGAPIDEVELALKRTGLALPKATRRPGAGETASPRTAPRAEVSPGSSPTASTSSRTSASR